MASINKIISKRKIPFIISIGLGVIISAVLIIGVLSNNSHTKVSAAAAAYKKQLQSQVDDVTGAPISGYDPAGQLQNSLVSVASKPTGYGQRIAKTPTTFNASTTTVVTTPNIVPVGLGPNGCFVDYGIQGQQCLPAHVAINGVLTCDGVRIHFPNGIKVTGTDIYHLDKNHDGIACDAADGP